MTFYEKSIIYKLKHNEDYDDTNIYIGSTSNFKNRKYQHKFACNNEKDIAHNRFVYQFIRDNGGWEQWVMIPIEEYPCNSKNELEIRERYNIDLLRPTLNKVIPTRSAKEWREDNKEIIKDKKKEDYIVNREYKLLKQKIYAENHKDEKKEYDKQNREKNKIEYYRKQKERNSQKVICYHCGGEYRYDNLKTHQRTKKCINFVKKD